MLASLTFKPTFDVSEDSQNKETDEKDSECCSRVVNIENWKNRKYVIWTIAAPIALLGYFVPYVHIVAYVEDILPGESGEALLTSIAITAGIGKIIFGLIADRPNINPICLQQFSFVFIGCCTMLLTTARFFGSYSYASLIVFALVMGLFDGCFSTMLGPIAVYICGPVGASQAIGFILGLCAGPLMLGPLIAGKSIVTILKFHKNLLLLYDCWIVIIENCHISIYFQEYFTNISGHMSFHLSVPDVHQ